MENEKNVNTYTYSAAQQEQVKRIYEQYAPKAESKMERLLRLDHQATRMGAIVATVVGVIGTLILGMGMCYFLKWSDFSLMGLVLSVPGLAAVLAAYPLNNFITAKYRKRQASEIIELCEELLVK